MPRDDSLSDSKCWLILTCLAVRSIQREMLWRRAAAFSPNTAVISEKRVERGVRVLSMEPSRVENEERLVCDGNNNVRIMKYREILGNIINRSLKFNKEK